MKIEELMFNQAIDDLKWRIDLTQRMINNDSKAGAETSAFYAGYNLAAERAYDDMRRVLSRFEELKEAVFNDANVRE